MLLLICFILSLFVNITVIWAIINLTRKMEIYEDFIDAMLRELQFVIEQMREVDIRGSFEADDEVGIVFKGLAGMVISLEAFLDKDSHGTT